MCGRYYRRGSFTIITTTPNELTGQVHTRMTVILHERDYDEWLLRESSAPAHLLQPSPQMKWIWCL